MTFLNNIRKVGRLVLSRTSCYDFSTMQYPDGCKFIINVCFTLAFVSVIWYEILNGNDHLGNVEDRLNIKIYM
jgi:hypothetical protein